MHVNNLRWTQGLLSHSRKALRRQDCGALDSDEQGALGRVGRLDLEPVRLESSFPAHSNLLNTIRWDSFWTALPFSFATM